MRQGADHEVSPDGKFAAALPAQKILSFHQRPAQAQPPAHAWSHLWCSTRSQELGMTLSRRVAQYNLRQSFPSLAGAWISLSRSAAQYSPAPKPSLKPTAVASVASRGERAEGTDSYAGCSSQRSPNGERENEINQRFSAVRPQSSHKHANSRRTSSGVLPNRRQILMLYCPVWVTRQCFGTKLVRVLPCTQIGNNRQYHGRTSLGSTHPSSPKKAHSPLWRTAM